VSTNKPYSAVNVKDVNLSKLLAELKNAGELFVGVDVGKESLLVAICHGRRVFTRVWRVDYPSQLRLLVELLGKLSENRKLTVAIEPTGTYADPLRYALKKADVPVLRIESKASHDYAEIFDGTPSQHDAKDAMSLAEMSFNGQGSPWPMALKSDRDAKMRTLVSQADDQQRVKTVWTGRLEGLLARHWPEATGVLDLDSATLLHVLIEYGGAAGLAEDAEAEAKLRAWGGPWLGEQKMQDLIGSARRTAGVPAGKAEMDQVRKYAQSALSAHRELESTRRQLEKLVEGDAVLERMGAAVGKATACVLWVRLGDPRDYTSVGAYLKAAGLNLAERSSGKYEGQLKISKRGPALVRKWLYMAAVRLLQKSPQAAAWFAAKKQRDGGGQGGGRVPRRRKGVGLIGLVALMRRLLGAVWYVVRKEEAFDAGRLFGQAARTAKQDPTKPAARPSAAQKVKAALS
jgi:transposase